jgi:hypothetical protein
MNQSVLKVILVFIAILSLCSVSMAQGMPFYQYFSDKNGHHFYTTDTNDIGTITVGIVGRHGYKFERITGYIHNSQQHGTVPFYQYFNPTNSDHFYTIDVNEIGTIATDIVGRHGYKFERIVGYIYDTQQHGTVPFYQYFNPTNSDHFYTIDVNEIGTIATDIVGRHGYKFERIAGYIYPARK